MAKLKFPLKYRTPSRWAAQALANPFALLSDHAYLERKAASNALEMLNRWPEPNRPDEWEMILSGVAKDEARHLDQVLKLLARRGGKLARLHKSQYATDLRALVRMGRGKEEILDRLLVCAVIEARSCERFHLLGRHCKDKELRHFYQSLEASEAGHFTVFLRLGRKILPDTSVEERWQDLLTAEARIIQQQVPGSGIHSGVSDERPLRRS
jgi:tRNA-(ms[2]io[6]A)-hydroxylase